MLKKLPIIPSRTSQNFYLLFFFISIAPPIIPFLFYCVNDNNYHNAGVTIYYLDSRLCLLIALIEYLTVLLGYLDLLQTGWQGTANDWEGLGPPSVPFGYTTV